MTRTQSLVSALVTGLVAAVVQIATLHYDAQADAVRATASAESYRALIEVAVQGRQPRGCPHE